MTAVLDKVLSVEPLETCARRFLGFACLSGTGYECTCDDVQSLNAETVRDEKGAPVLVLTLEQYASVPDTKTLTSALHRTGYRGDWEIRRGGLNRGHTVVVSYDLFRPENRDLKVHVEQSL